MAWLRGIKAVIALLVPSMPRADQILPYLCRIDQNRWYSNGGPLVQELESRLSTEFYRGARVVTCSSCTAGLQMVYNHERIVRGYTGIELPALTFPAPWMAALHAGMKIKPIDVDPYTWIAPGVAGFGVPSIGPVIDAAGAFGEQKIGPLNTAVFSLHATKPLGCGEGGFVVTWDDDLVDHLRQMQNFGMLNGKSVTFGMNYKMSEYAAAVALAALDNWNRDPWLQLFDWYSSSLSQPWCVLSGIRQQKRPRGVYSLLPVYVPVSAQAVLEAMATEGIECRRWYTPAMDRHVLFQPAKRKGGAFGGKKNTKPPAAHLPVTRDLEEHLIGLPYHLDLTAEQVGTICRTLSEVIDALKPN